MGTESVWPSSRTGLGRVRSTPATFWMLDRLSGATASPPEGKNAASRRLTTNPRGSSRISILPVLISSLSSLVRNCNEGSSSATSGAGGLVSFSDLLAPPGPRICALPLPFSSTVPPRISLTAEGTPPFSRASRTESETCLALALSVWEEANITTKKANSSVMKSAYETSQRSWFSGAACFLARAMGDARLTFRRRGVWSGFGGLGLLGGLFALGLVRVGFQPAADELGVESFHDPGHALQHQLLVLNHRVHASFDFVAGRKEEKVSRGY